MSASTLLSSPMTLFRTLITALALLLATATAADPLPQEAARIRDALAREDLEAAIEASERAMKDARDARVLLWAGRAFGLQALKASLLTKLKWAGRTREAWEKAVELDPNGLEARFDLLQYYLQAPSIAGGGRDKAEAQVRRIAALDPAQGKLAESYLALADGDAQRALSLQREAYAMDADAPRIALALAMSLQRDARWEAVQALWSERLARRPGDALARYQLGRLAAVRGENLEEGLALLDAFIAAGEVPDGLSLAAAHWRRAQILEKLGRIDEARAALARATADPAVRRLAEADIERLGRPG